MPIKKIKNLNESLKRAIFLVVNALVKREKHIFVLIIRCFFEKEDFKLKVAKKVLFLTSKLIRKLSKID